MSTETPTPETKLEPCPFCGKEPSLFGGQVICFTPDCAMPAIQAPVERWNTRAPSDLEAQAAAMREACERSVDALDGIADLAFRKAMPTTASAINAAQDYLTKALSSTAGADLAERLRKAEGERDAAQSLQAEWKGNFSFISKSLEARNRDALALEQQRDDAMALAGELAVSLKRALRQWRGYAEQREDEDLEKADHWEGQIYRDDAAALSRFAERGEKV